MRLFVAVWPPAEVVAALAGLPRPAVDGVRWVPAENLHVTLRFLGHADPDEVVARLRAAALTGATAHVGPTTTALGRRLVVAPVAGLDALAAAVVAATADLGQPPEERPFVGHVTLARLGAAAPRGTAAALAGAATTATFPVGEVAVVRSDTRPSGAAYTTVATAPTD